MCESSSQHVERLESHLSTSHVNPRIAVLENQDEVIEKASPLESMSNTAVDTPQDTQDIPTSDDTEIAPRVRKSRIGHPLAVYERLGIFDAIRQMPATATGRIICFKVL